MAQCKFFAKSAWEYVLSTLDHIDIMNHNLLDSVMLHLYFGIPFSIDDLVVWKKNVRYLNICLVNLSRKTKWYETIDFDEHNMT